MPGPVLAISSQVAFAPVGNSAAIPALTAAGLEVMAVPTVILSNHPGLGTPAGLCMPAETLATMLKKLQALGALKDPSGIITGYFADAAQVDAVADFISAHRQAFYLCDPVIGDDPMGLYVPEDVAARIRDRLLPLAHAITRNRFEREWLGDLSHVAERITTSLPESGQLITELEADAIITRHATIRRDGVPHGTGDLLSGLYLAARLTGHSPQEAFPRAMAKLEAVIARSIGRPGLALDGLAG